MHSVRLRIAGLAAIATAVAVAVVALLLLGQLRSVLLDEITDSIADQALDYEGAIFTEDDIVAARVPGDLETLFVVLDGRGEIVDSNDEGVSGDELVGQLDLASAQVDGLQLVSDVSFTTPSQTPGAEQMHVAYIDLANLESDDPVYVVVARSTVSVDRTVASIRNVLLIGLPLLVLFVAALAWWLTGRSLRPVERMRREVDDISSTDLARRVSEPRSTDEIGELASTMNRMLERLERAQDSQDQFVSDAAHELRTPLASIAAQLDVDATHPETADLDATAHRVRGEVTRLQSLIDGLLQSARSVGSASDQPPSRTLVDLDVVATEAASRASAHTDKLIDQRSISVGTVRGDEGALTRLVDNLLANALRHAAETVSVGVGSDADGVWLMVDDDGAGVPAGDRERIFDRFARLDDARSRDEGGSGLGLFLARETAIRHGGTLTVTTSPQGGARFVLRLPNAGQDIAAGS